jgi:Mce-associated membrane protein
VTSRTTTALTVCSLLLATGVAGEAWYLWGVSPPTPSAQRPVVVGDIDARSAVETAAQDAAAIFTVSWKSYDAHVEQATALMTDRFAAAYRTSAAPVKAQVVSAQTRTTTRVAGSGVVRATHDQVLALLFLDQRVTSSGGPASYNARSALVTMVRTDHGWLVDNVQTG